MATRNQFEQVDEVQPDALNLTLTKGADATSGTFQCSAAATQGRLPKGYNSGPMPVQEAFRGAVKFANDFKLPIVVIDAEGAWDEKWGDLYRVSDEEGEEEAPQA